MIKDIILSLCRRVRLNVEHFAEFDCLATCVLKVAIDQNNRPVCVIRLAIISKWICLAGRQRIQCCNDGFGTSMSGAIEIKRRIILVHDFKRVPIAVEAAVVELKKAICNRLGIHPYFLSSFFSCLNERYRLAIGVVVVVCCCFLSFSLFFSSLYSFFERPYTGKKKVICFVFSTPEAAMKRKDEVARLGLSSPRKSESSQQQQQPVIIANRFRLVSKLGQGSFGDIFQAVDMMPKHGKLPDVAIKFEFVRSNKPQLRREYDIYQVLHGGGK